MDTLFEAAGKGDKSAMEEIILKNRALVYSVAGRFGGRGAETDDLVQVGFIGLCKAVKGFEPKLGYKFSTYAVWLIMGEIKRFLRDNGSVKVSRRLKEISQKVRFAENKLRMESGSEPTVEEIAFFCNIPKEDVILAAEAVREPCSLQEKFGEDAEYIQTLAAGGVQPDNIDRIALKEAMGKMTEKEQKLIILRYFMDKTQSETARVFGISQVQVSRIEKKALEKMREYMAEKN